MTTDSPNYSDIQIKFSEEELNRLKKDTKKILACNRILKVEKLHFCIYIILLVVSVSLLVPYLFVLTNCEQTKNIFSTMMSIGAGIIGAVILAYLIEWSNTMLSDKKVVRDYNSSIQNIHFTLWKVFACRSLSIFKGKAAQAKPFLDQMTDMYISYYELAINQIDAHMKQFENLINAERHNELVLVKERLIKFISDLKNQIDPEHRLLLLDGTKDWLKGHCTLEWLKKQFLIF